jgi:hypothetical protein
MNEETKITIENNEEIITKKETKPERPRKKRKKLIFRILNILLWIILIIWAVMVVTDYININKEKDPKFCWFNEKTTEYEDGTVTECSGIGYKVIKYNRTSFKAIEFGPFWIKDRSNK